MLFSAYGKKWSEGEMYKGKKEAFEGIAQK